MHSSPQPSIDKPGIMAASFAALGWASTGIFVRNLPGWPPLNIVAGRFLVALLAVCVLIAISRKKNTFARSLLQPKCWALSALMMAYYLCATVAFQMAPVGEVALCISTSPLFVLIFQLVLQQPTPNIEKVGSAIAFVGVTLVFLPILRHSGEAFPDRFMGISLALAGAMIMATYALNYQANTKTLTAPSSSAVAFLTFLAGLILLTSWLGLTGHLTDVPVSPSLRPLALLLGLGIIATIMPTLCYSVASQRLPSMLTTSIRLLTPIFSALLGMIFIAEIPTNWFWLGGSLVIGGLLLMTWQRRGAKRE